MRDGDNPSCHEAAWGSWVLFAPVPISSWGEHMVSLLAFPVKGPYHPKPGSSGSPLPSSREGPGLVMTAVHLCGQAEPAAAAGTWHCPRAERELLKAVLLAAKFHTLLLKRAVPCLPGIRAAYFSDQKPVFSIVSTEEPRGSGRVSWLLLCFARHQQNCQLVSCCRVFITSNDLWGRINIFTFKSQVESAGWQLEKTRIFTC